MTARHETQQRIQSTGIEQPKIPLAKLQEQAAANRSGKSILPEESAGIDLPEGLRNASNQGHTIIIDMAGHTFVAPKINRPSVT